MLDNEAVYDICRTHSLLEHTDVTVMLDNEAVYDICRTHSLLEHTDVPDTMNNESRHRGQRATMRCTPPR